MEGCGIFDTRTPQQPNTSRSTYVPPTSPDLVISNLTYSIQEKNVDNYINCISPGAYSFIPDSKSQLLYGTIFQNWSINAERNYMNNLIAQTNSSATSDLFLDNANLTSLSPDSAVYQANYTVVFQHNRTDIPKSAVGTITLFLKANESNLFYIVKWEDFRMNDTDFTWSALKANFSN